MTLRIDSQTGPTIPAFNFDHLPALLSAAGVQRRMMDLSRSTLYRLATSGEVETVSAGTSGKKSSRLFVVASIARWLERRAATTVRPNLKPRKTNGK